MSGHSKWNNIKRKKEATDAVKGKIFTKIGREITVCVKEGGADPNNNSKLRDLIAKAKANNVPNDNIERVIKKASGDGEKNNYETMIYEAVGNFLTGLDVANVARQLYTGEQVLNDPLPLKMRVLDDE